METDRVDALIHTLEELSPMPDDGSPELTVERLRRYGEVLERIGEIIEQSGNTLDSRLIKPLIRSFSYGDAYEVAWTVLATLEKFPLDSLRPALREAVQAGERGARMWSIFMLGRQRNYEDVPLLTTALKDPEYKVRQNALAALAMIGDLSAKAAMEELLDDPVEEVRKGAREDIPALLDQRYVVR
ncbi:MAG: HEAT repeat domain-containing protein [Chloroflexi bacterium]|nr:HEAT repeat domain-containing protein [Chloroflexota bacterium]